MKPQMLGLVGPSGSGKTTAARYLSERFDFYPITLSSYLKKMINKKDGAAVVNKETLQDEGNKLRQEHGPQILAQLAWQDLHSREIDKAVIDGIRNIYEISFLEVEDNFTLVGINADAKVRYERIVELRGKKWVGDYDNFLEVERREDELGDEHIGLRVTDCLNKADIVIENNASVDQLYSELNRVITTI